MQKNSKQNSKQTKDPQSLPPRNSGLSKEILMESLKKEELNEQDPEKISELTKDYAHYFLEHGWIQGSGNALLVAAKYASRLRMSNEDRMKELCEKPAKGILLYGPTGTGGEDIELIPP